MTRDEFLTEMQDVLQTEETLSFETVLEELDEWDSLAVMATMAFLAMVKLKTSSPFIIPCWAVHLFPAASSTDKSIDAASYGRRMPPNG